MDWFAVYGKLISYRQENKLIYIKGKTPGIERHHIIPLSQNGPDIDSNIICLTAREHFIAHKILHKMYPQNIYLLNAAYKMAKFKDKGKHTCRLYRVSSRDIEQLRKDLTYFLKNSKWINNGKGSRHRIWNNEEIPDGWFDGMGESSNKFKTSMNDRAKKQHPIIVDGIVYSPKDIAEKYGIPRSQVLKRLRKGWSVEKIISTSYVKQDNSFTDGDMQELQALFEEWKTTKTSELINKHPNIFNGRHGKINNIRLVTLFKQKIPDYVNFKNQHTCIHSADVITYKGKTMTIKEWGNETGIPSYVIRSRYNLGWDINDIFTKPVVKPGQNFADDEKTKNEKRELVALMLNIYKQNGYGKSGLSAVNKHFNMNIGFDGLIRKFRKYGFNYTKPKIVFDYHGKQLSINELLDFSEIPYMELYNRLVSRNLLTKYSIDDLLKKNLPDNHIKYLDEYTSKMYKKLKPMFDVYAKNNGGIEGYNAVQAEFNYDTNYCNLRRVFLKYVPEYSEFQKNKKLNIRKVIYNSREMTISEFANAVGMPVKIVRSRLDKGWTPDKIAEHPLNYEKTADFRKNEIRPLFDYWSKCGFAGLNDKFKTSYKNEECAVSLFRKYFNEEYAEIMKKRKSCFTDLSGNLYTMSELKKLTGLTRVMISARINAGCRTVSQIIDFDNSNIAVKVDLLRKYLNSYNIGGMRQVKQDFPDCKYSGSSLRAMFNRYLPDAYRPSEQNKKDIRIRQGEPITINGITKAIGEWARECGLPVCKIRQRLNHGIIGENLLKKERLNANQIEYGEKTYNGYAELARAYGIDRSTLLGRIRRGMTLDEALSKSVRRKKQ